MPPGLDVQHDLVAVAYGRERAADGRLGRDVQHTVPYEVPLMRASETRSMSVTPCQQLAGIGSWPHSGMPGPPPDRSSGGPARVGADIQRGVVDSRRDVVDILEHEARAAMA